MTTIRRLCVYCGSSGRGPATHAEAAHALGVQMAAEGVGLVYGGGRVGIMGAVSAAVMEGGGEVIGIIPDFLLQKEVGNRDVTDLEIVTTMHQRKARMVELADGFVILPGGLGTLDEFFEVLTWRQLGLHDKPIVVANIDGYWDRLTALMDGMIADKYVHSEQAAKVHYVSRIDEVLPALRTMPASTHPPLIQRT